MWCALGVCAGCGVSGYTRKVGLRKPEWDDDEPDVTLDELMSNTYVVCHADGGQSRGLMQVVEGAFKANPDWLRDQVRRSAATLDGLPPEMCETLAHRTRGRKFQVNPVTVAVERKPCPHCPCTYTTECCYCDGSQTPLEDS